MVPRFEHDLVSYSGIFIATPSASLVFAILPRGFLHGQTGTRASKTLLGLSEQRFVERQTARASFCRSQPSFLRSEVPQLVNLRIEKKLTATGRTSLAQCSSWFFSSYLWKITLRHTNLCGVDFDPVLFYASNL